VLVDEPVEGASIDARGERWRITRIRLPWGLDAPGDVVYELDVEAAPARPPSNGF